jgi:hypothetical protein
MDLGREVVGGKFPRRFVARGFGGQDSRDERNRETGQGRVARRFGHGQCVSAALVKDHELAGDRRAEIAVVRGARKGKRDEWRMEHWRPSAANDAPSRLPPGKGYPENFSFFVA